MKLYFHKGDTTNAIYMANSIVKMKMKVPSEKGRFIKKKAKELLMLRKKQKKTDALPFNTN